VRAVADTGPLNYLVLVGQIDLVARLFGGLSIPTLVRDELNDPMAPAAVRAWIAAPPGWLSIIPVSARVDAALASLDEGEQAAIALAATIKADVLLIDDRAGVAVARAQGIEVTGTIGVLDRAAQNGLIDLASAFSALRATNFHVRQDWWRPCSRGIGKDVRDNRRRAR
jgi:predicted nucleic acid-binding protein